MTPENPSPKPPRRAGPLVGGLVVALAVGAVGGYALTRDDGGTTTTTVVQTVPPRTVTTTVQAAAASASSSVSDGTRTPAEIYRLAAPGVVDILAQTSNGASEGTGFVIDKQGRILTNEHVVAGADRITVSFADGKQTQARLMGTDPSNDLALLKVTIAASELHPIELGSSAKVVPGDPVVAIGNPFGYARSISAGIVSALNRDITAPNRFNITGAIQTDAAINHGNSGGPLLDGQARVIGITAQIADSGVDANVGVGFAVPIDAATRELQALERGNVKHAWLGISGQTITPAIAAAAGVKSANGVLVTGVIIGGPAAQAGLLDGTRIVEAGGTRICAGGDSIVGINGTKVTGMSDLQSIISQAKPTATVTLSVLHAGSAQRDRITVTLRPQPGTAPAGSDTGCGH
jgi:S1-C subfamily serine protease